MAVRGGGAPSSEPVVHLRGVPGIGLGEHLLVRRSWNLGNWRQGQFLGASPLTAGAGRGGERWVAAAGEQRFPGSAGTVMEPERPGAVAAARECFLKLLSLGAWGGAGARGVGPQGRGLGRQPSFVSLHLPACKERGC